MRYLTIIALIIFLIYILIYIKKDKLNVKFSILWIILDLFLMLKYIFPGIFIKICEKIGIYYPHALILGMGILVLSFYVIYISIVLRKQNKIITKLTQEIAVLKNNIKNKERD